MPDIVVGWSVGLSVVYFMLWLNITAVMKVIINSGHHRFNKQDQSSHITHGDTAWKRHGHLFIRQ